MPSLQAVKNWLQLYSLPSVSMIQYSQIQPTVDHVVLYIIYLLNSILFFHLFQCLLFHISLFCTIMCLFCMIFLYSIALSLCINFWDNIILASLICIIIILYNFIIQKFRMIPLCQFWSNLSQSKYWGKAFSSGRYS